MRIPQNLVDQIHQTDIVPIVQAYVPSLKPKGSRWICKSPFRPEERTPSFVVTPSKNIFKCFSTGPGGGPVAFVMQMEKCGYREALEIVAKFAGLTIPEDEEDPGQDIIYSVNDYYADRWHRILMKSPDALRYLVEDREMTLPLIQEYRLGYVPVPFEMEKFDPSVLLDADVFRFSEHRRAYYPTFFQRITFPYMDRLGRVTGFTARILQSKEGVPKYINSKETRVFHKEKQLYGLYQSRNGIRKNQQSILVEGPTDVIGLRASGIDYALASNGTAFSTHQAGIVAQLCDRSQIWFDGDAAGQKATFKAVDSLLSKNVIPTLIAGGNQDPDEVRRTGSVPEYVQTHTVNFVERYYQIYQGGDVKIKQAAIQRLCETISKVPDYLDRKVISDEAAGLFGIPPTDLHRRVSKMVSGTDITPSADRGYEMIPEYVLLQLAIHYPGKYTDIESWLNIEPLIFDDPIFERIRQQVFCASPDFMKLATGETASLYAAMASQTPAEWEPEKVFRVCLAVRAKHLQVLLKKIQGEITEKINSGEDYSIEVEVHAALIQQINAERTI
jgi:DNA primase